MVLGWDDGNLDRKREQRSVLRPPKLQKPGSMSP